MVFGRIVNFGGNGCFFFVGFLLCVRLVQGFVRLDFLYVVSNFRGGIVIVFLLIVEDSRSEKRVSGWGIQYLNRGLWFFKVWAVVVVFFVTQSLTLQQVVFDMIVIIFQYRLRGFVLRIRQNFLVSQWWGWGYSDVFQIQDL